MLPVGDSLTKIPPKVAWKDALLVGHQASFEQQRFSLGHLSVHHSIPSIAQILLISQDTGTGGFMDCTWY